MDEAPRTRVAIVGAGRGGSALLELFQQIDSIEVVGIADRDPAAPGFQRARASHIPTTTDVSELIRNPAIALILDVTGNADMEMFLRARKAPTTELLSGSASRLLWQIIQHESVLEAELLQAEKLAGIGSFAAGIAHDINNPLQLILGLAESLLEERDLSTIHDQARDIVDAVKRTSTICRDLTRYSRRSSADENTLIPLNAKIDEALKIARYAARIHDIDIVKHYAPGATVRGNPDELLHVFVNLITNAVQAMEQVGGTLTLTTRITGDTVDVQISDTGCGIPPDRQEAIFEPFFTTKAPGKGTGLGLYNVRNIIQHMHGTIVFESEVDKGTTFTLSFLTRNATAEGCTV